MARMICVEAEEAELFINLDRVNQATVTPETVRIEYDNGQTHSFTGAAAHTLIQALRHEEKRTQRLD